MLRRLVCFLDNSYKLKAAKMYAVLTVLVVSADEIDEAGFVDWIRKNAIPR